MKETADQGIELDGVSIAPGVVETIISLAAAEVPGVSGKAIPTTGIKLAKGEDGKLSVEITIQAYYGYRLTEVAENVRLAIADAIKGQTGADVASVDVYVDGLSFEE